VPNPLIVVEILSPSSERLDKAGKLADYFSIPSIEHDLIVDLKRRDVIHHSRSDGSMISTRIVREGDIVLDPPGITIVMADTFGD
jgi:Uma2 family endonuclease